MISHGKNVKVFCANANRPFAEGVCRKLWLPLGDCTVTTFADGEVSLTINEVEDTPAGTRISINLIPHTFEHTAFKHTKKRDLVNVEVDTVARYIERMYSLTEHK